MLDFVMKMFGSKHEKDVKKLRPLVDEINNIYESYHSLSDEQLKAKTDEFKAVITESVADIQEELDSLRKSLAEDDLSAPEIADINEKIRGLDKELFEHIQVTLDDLLPDAFAVVKQACKRLADRGHTYTYADQPARWEMIPYDVQLIGGIVLHEGKIAEMATGEGKTLVAVAAVYLNALPGKGVHLVTVNDYLAKRDAEWMGPVYEFLGLTVASLQSNMDHEKRKKIYAADITYGTNNEFGFDYLRDNMVTDIEHKVQRGHWYSIVDEIDSVLIDEARTPLIISGPVGQSDQRYEEINPSVKRLVDAQSRLVTEIVAEAQRLLESGTKEDREKAGEQILRANRGLPKHKRLQKLLQDPDNKKLLRDTELFYLREQGRRMHEIDDELYYVVEEKNHIIDLTEKGREHISTKEQGPEMFVIPDIASSLSAIEGDNSLSEDEKQLKKDEVYQIYAERSDRIHTIQQLLRAYSLYEKDVEYIIQDGKINIVDEHTGRVLEGRRYSEGLHQAIEAKEHVKVERDTQTFATITLQNYFRLYHKLSGMTGTAETEAAEFDKIYQLEVVVIPTNRPIVRDDQDDLIFKTTREKYNSIIDEIINLQKQGRAVLVGTASVEVSEILSKMLKRKQIRHNVLNAKQHQKEAEVVAHAGKKGAVTIATNMAGRGTDIKLDPEVKKNGGLAILGSERHDARRIDRQLRGRAGRQGDPGSSIFYISLEDKLMRLFGGERIANVMSRMKIPEGEAIQHSMISGSVEKAQKKVEENNFAVRKRLLEYDDVMNQQREVIYARRNAALRGDRLKGEIFEFVEDLAYDWYDEFKPLADYEGLKNTVRSNLLSEIEISKSDFEKMKEEEVVEAIVDAARKFYKRKEETLGKEFMARLERVAVLKTIDEKWRDHLRLMDDLKEGIHLRSYGQKNPILEYKGEAFKLFVDLIKDINKETANFAFRFFPKIVKEERRIKPGQKAPSQESGGELPKLRSSAPDSSSYTTSREAPAFVQTATSGVPQQEQPQGQATTVKQTFKRDERKIGRNDIVKVVYADGKIKQTKFKKVEEDVASGIAEVIED